MYSKIFTLLSYCNQKLRKYREDIRRKILEKENFVHLRFLFKTVQKDYD